MRSLSRIAAWLCIGLALGSALYHAGRAASARECPNVQQGEKLLYSEQRPGTTLCAYSHNSEGYGRNIKRRKP